VCGKEMNYGFAVEYYDSYTSNEQYICVELSSFETKQQFRCMHRIDIKNILKYLVYYGLLTPNLGMEEVHR
jgi:hypothetical protein